MNLFKKQEPKKNIDAFGKEVFIGDTVAFAIEAYFFGAPYATMKIGEINSIEDNCARVKFVDSDKETRFVSVNIKNLVKNTNNCKPFKNDDWDTLKKIANDCGIFTDNYGDPLCSDWDAVMRFAIYIAEHRYLNCK